MYSCPSCHQTFEHFNTPGKCPHCGIYAGVRCGGCGYSASADTFISNNDRCPKCGAKVSIPGAAGGGCLVGLLVGLLPILLAFGWLAA